MAKSPDAFRTISEVADWLGVQAHVLRFWESKFSQVKPIKRAGGRRYYRPTDMLLIGGIKKLLHDDGMTIKGAQKLLRENGVAFVADMSQPLDDLTIAVIEGQATPAEAADETAHDLAELDADEVATTQDPLPDPDTDAAADDPEAEHADAAPDTPDLPETDDTSQDIPAEPEPVDPLELHTPVHSTDDALVEDEAGTEISAAAPVASADQDASHDTSPEPITEPVEVDEPESDPVLEAHQAESESEHEPEPERAPEQEEAELSTELQENPEETVPVMPAFRARSRAPRDETPREESAVEPSPNTDPEPAPEATSVASEPQIKEATEEAASALPKPLIVDIPPVPKPSEITVDPSVLTLLSEIKSVTPDQAREIRPLLARLTRLRASIASPRKEVSKD